MRIALATLMLVLTLLIAAHAEDRYSGRYAAECGRYVCKLDIAPRRGGWIIRWTATDPTILDAKPVCVFTTTAELGSAEMGAAGVVTGIAVGEWRRRPFGLFDLGDGRVSWSSTWAACPGIAPRANYTSFRDE